MGEQVAARLYKKEKRKMVLAAMKGWKGFWFFMAGKTAVRIRFTDETLYLENRILKILNIRKKKRHPKHL